jgi:hypothetical protein
VLDPLHWNAWYGQEDDPEVVRRCYDETASVLQQGLDRLVAEAPNTLLDRLRRQPSNARPAEGQGGPGTAAAMAERAKCSQTAAA